MDLVLLYRERGMKDDEEAALRAGLAATNRAEALLALSSAPSSLPQGHAAVQLYDQLLGRLDAGDLQAARLLLNSALAAHADDPLLDLCRAELMLAGSGRRGTAALVHRLTELTRREPQLWEARLLLGRLLLERGPLFNAALGTAFVEEAYWASGRDARAAGFLASAWRAAGRHRLADALQAG